jgi:general secretion pathway protein D
VLSGASFNGIPVISNRKLQSKVRLREGQWGVVAGLINLSDTRSVSGWPGLSRLPLLGQALRQHTRSGDSTEILVLLKPQLLDPPPAGPAPPLYLGSESRLRIPL